MITQERLNAGLPLESPVTRPTWLLKRSLDVAGSLFGLMLLWPLMAVVAVLIRLDSKGPALFTQTRVGYLGRPFTMVKFRTMVPNADQFLPELMHHNEADGPMFKMTEDPRITRLGQFLRKTSLDELPQLWNVLKGDMSLVGPRPPLPWEVRQYTRHQLLRLKTKPGMTGSWQVSGRASIQGFDEVVRLDVQYIRHWSVARDLGILALTVPAVISRKGAH
jgi:exopolysaccharide biosynthesis polyprenyl glycosylphosphotransferase